MTKKLVYFDSSALVKLMLDEPGRDLALDLWNGCDGALSSRLAYPEVCAAIAAAHRNHVLDDVGVRRAQRTWEKRWAMAYPVDLGLQVETHAGELTARHSLRGADAVHLASALAVGEPDLVVAVWDKHLHAGAIAEGFAVTPTRIER